ncbi:hypothetical protein SMACR_06331 [Sordaria macrospora]|uniref:WGS project CABT00000000 data, contig 2.34 n=2 Tax=Sordaria macrospora TaxID=5147 RepID=F7W6H4_SORMK|nr:uncharacterized protein SMAC_06331 [Sordaria macrospora k-hell]KAA8635182.1 hypothetical protein SMACR_06331 [Sordaria macrospora]KAH7630395.1 hypothetical protein B0T09DRAFT_341733 [Sordaria sp. MPI-SDFR-AT-0083]WPJ67062.1 hypothetical protein SMAC4_06331 [Sordaria macrospora]CCC13113.1 unnamed protein product [Sordaria macrospora k-hell]
MSTSSTSSIALIGSTGLVGSHILSTFLTSPSTASQIQTISRRAPSNPTNSTRLSPTVNADTSTWPTLLSSLVPLPTTVISSLGTTRGAAGGIANQWKIDHDLNVDLAKAAKQAGVKNFVFVSSAGTRSLLSSKVPYSQMKRGVEDTIQSLEFEHGIILRPGLILGERDKAHFPGQGLLVSAVRGLGKWVSQSWLQDSWAQEADVIARAAVKAVRMAEEGKAPAKWWVLEQDEIVKLGRDEWKE